jgi:hypothetical protein
MDETPIADLNYLICQLAEFYNGSVSYKELQSMPLPEVYELYKNALKIQEEIKRQTQRSR